MKNTCNTNRKFVNPEPENDRHCDIDKGTNTFNELVSPIVVDDIDPRSYAPGLVDPAMFVAGSGDTGDINSLFGLLNNQLLGDIDTEKKITADITADEVRTRRIALNKMFGNRVEFIMQTLINNLNNSLIQIIPKVYPFAEVGSSVVPPNAYVGFDFRSLHFTTDNGFDQVFSPLMCNSLASGVTMNLYRDLYSSLSWNLSSNGRPVDSISFCCDQITDAFCKFHDSLNTALYMLEYEKQTFYYPNAYMGTNICDNWWEEE